MNGSPLNNNMPNNTAAAPVPMATAMPLQSQAYVMPKSKGNKGMMVFMTLLILILVIAVGGLAAYILMNPPKTVEPETVYLTSYTTVTVFPPYEQVIPVGWTAQTDTASRIGFALPSQETYVPSQDTTPAGESNFSWYVKATTDMNYLSPTGSANLQLFKTPGGKDRSLFGCGIGCADESFVSVDYMDSTKTTDELFADFKANAEAKDASYEINGKTILASTKINKWGQTVYKVRIRAGGDSPERNHYIIGTGTRAYYIDFYSTNDEFEADQVLDSLIFN